MLLLTYLLENSGLHQTATLSVDVVGAAVGGVAQLQHHQPHRATSFIASAVLYPPVTKGFTVGLKFSKYSNLSSRYEFQSTSISNPPHQVLPMTQQFCSNFTPLEEGNDTLTKCHCWIIALFAAPGPGCNKIGPQTTTRGQAPAADGRRWWERTQHTKPKKHWLRCGHLHNTRGAARELD